MGDIAIGAGNFVGGLSWIEGVSEWVEGGEAVKKLHLKKQDRRTYYR